MDITCGFIKGGWLKIADVHDGENCPSPWKSFTIPGTIIKVCRSDSSGANSATYSITEPFQHFCGRLIGYQKGTPDAFDAVWVGGKHIDELYLDGVSITYGEQRKHLFSLGMGASCPCTDRNGPLPPSFVRDNYYCDEGDINPVLGTYYPNNKVWDGENCFSNNSCCAQPNMPYFYRQLSMEVKEDIEVRLITNQNFFDEAVLIGSMELYVL